MIGGKAAKGAKDRRAPPPNCPPTCIQIASGEVHSDEGQEMRRGEAKEFGGSVPTLVGKKAGEVRRMLIRRFSLLRRNQRKSRKLDRHGRKEGETNSPIPGNLRNVSQGIYR